MIIPQKTLISGFSLPVLGYGTWQLGGRFERNPKNDDEGDIRAIRTAVDFGLKHIDTAELYAAGHAEELVGEAIRPYERSSLFLTSKAHWDHLAPDQLRRACEGSLRRLGTSYLDLYLAHAFSDTVPLGETMRAMNQLVDEGLVRAIGVSNFSPKHVSEAQALSHHKIVCDQVHYSLLTREPEHAGLLDYCQTHDVFLVAYRPVEKGFISQHPPTILNEMAAKYQKTTTQIALNWLFSQKNVVALVMSRSVEHLKENVGADGWHLSDDDIELLRKTFPNQRAVSDVVPLE